MMKIDKLRGGGLLWTAPRNVAFFDHENNQKDRLMIFSKKSIFICKIPKENIIHDKVSSTRFYSHRLMRGFALKVIDRSRKDRRKLRLNARPTIVIHRSKHPKSLTCQKHSSARPPEFDKWLKDEIKTSSHLLNPLTKVSLAKYNRRLSAMKACSQILGTVKLSFEGDNPEPMKLSKTLELYRRQFSSITAPKVRIPASHQTTPNIPMWKPDQPVGFR